MGHLEDCAGLVQESSKAACCNFGGFGRFSTVFSAFLATLMMARVLLTSLLLVPGAPLFMAPLHASGALGEMVQLVPALTVA